MLNKKQKVELKAQANTLKPLYQIGKNDIGDTQLDLIDKALAANELIKISVLKTQDESVTNVAMELSSALHADVVQMVGRVITLYRKKPAKNQPKTKKND